MFFPSWSPPDDGLDGACEGGEGAWCFSGGALEDGAEDGWREEADRNMSCHAGEVEEGSEYGTSSMVR